MRKYIVFGCLAILLSLATSARADDVTDEGAETTAVTSAATISEFLAACPHLTACYNLMVLGNVADDGPPPKICMPMKYVSADYKAIFDWLGAHPETHRMKPMDGVIYAMKKLHPCK